MNKASSLIVLVLLGSLVADAVAQTNPRGDSYTPPTRGTPQVPGQPRAEQPQSPQQPRAEQPQHQQPRPQLPQQPQGPISIGSRVISGRILQSIRSFDLNRVTDLLRVSMSESYNQEVLSLSIIASALRNQASLELRSRGRSVSPVQLIRRQSSEVKIILPVGILLEELEIAVSDDVQIESLAVEVQSIRGGGGGYNPGPMRPMTGQFLSLDVRQSIRISGEVPLRQLVQQQLGLSLDGASIERISLQVQVMGYGQASVQVEMNGRLIGPAKLISGAQRNVPILINSSEAVRGTLRLIVRGDVVINGVGIRVGQVR